MACMYKQVKLENIPMNEDLIIAEKGRPKAYYYGIFMGVVEKTFSCYITVHEKWLKANIEYRKDICNSPIEEGKYKIYTSRTETYHNKELEFEPSKYLFYVMKEKYKKQIVFTECRVAREVFEEGNLKGWKVKGKITDNDIFLDTTNLKELNPFSSKIKPFEKHINGEFKGWHIGDLNENLFFPSYAYEKKQ